MWKFTSNVISSIGLKKSSSKPSCSECSDDENASNISREEGLECPICWESFNIVENVPYVLWCGHSLCKNCVLGLQTASLNFPSKQIRVPFLISCPWCQLLSLRLVCGGGNLKFPRKNFFLLWMVESLNGDRAKFVSSPRANIVSSGSRPSSGSPRWVQNTRNITTQVPSNAVSNIVERPQPQISLSKSLDMFIDLLSKFPLVIIFLLILFFAIPGSAIVLVVYFLLTAFFAVPAILVLYFAYPVLSWLIKEITS